ncbi:MAG: hypothetical protein Kow0026_15490 [Oricola sp.]
MASIRQLEPGVYVASQLAEDDFAALAEQGIRAVVANRPDGEAEGQMPSADAARAARRHGLAFRYLPVASFDVTDPEPVAAQARALAELPGPVLLYCRSGNRSAILWAQVAAPRLGADIVLRHAARAGFDLAELREFLDGATETLAA